MQPVVEGRVRRGGHVLDDLAVAVVGGGVLRDLAGLDGVDDLRLELAWDARS